MSGRTVQELQSRLSQFMQENKAMASEYQILQENVKKSSMQMTRIDQELVEYKQKYPMLVQENEQLKRKIMGEF
jgi:chromosome segregation ATPase